MPAVPHFDEPAAADILKEAMDLMEYSQCLPDNWNSRPRNTASINMADSTDPAVAIQAATMQFQHDTSGTGSCARNLGADPTVASTYHIPEPPAIHVPPPEDGLHAPTFDGICGDDLAEADLRIITQTEFTPVDNSAKWTYEMRRQAQKILPFLYLGPWEILKTQMDFIGREEISMLLVVRDTATARAGIMNPKKYAEALGIMYDSIDVGSNQELTAVLPHAVRIINNHLVNCYRQQVQATNFIPGESPFRMGKIFLYCESGNIRSAAIAVAYIMAMYNLPLVLSLQFVQAQRFCVSLDEPLKHCLDNYEGILAAQRIVHAARKQTKQAEEQSTQVSSRIFGPSNTTSAKRGRSMDEDDEMDDEERFEGRSTFQPFVQKAR